MNNKINKFTIKGAETDILRVNKSVSKVKILKAAHINEATLQVSVELVVNDDRFYDIYYVFDLKDIGKSLQRNINDSIRHYKNVDKDTLLSMMFTKKQYFNLYSLISGEKLDSLNLLILNTINFIDKEKYNKNYLMLDKLKETMFQNHYLANGTIDPFTPKATYSKPKKHLRIY